MLDFIDFADFAKLAKIEPPLPTIEELSVTVTPLFLPAAFVFCPVGFLPAFTATSYPY